MVLIHFSERKRISESVNIFLASWPPVMQDGSAVHRAKISLEAQTPEQAGAANSLLLITSHRHPGLINWRAVDQSIY